MRKLPQKDDVVDEFIVDNLCEPIIHQFYLTGHTANIISMYGLLFTIISLYRLYNDQIAAYLFYFWLSYWIDCMDGYYARRYGMVTRIGDIFEHVRDILSVVVAIAICMYKWDVDNYAYITFFIAGGLTGINVGCTQKMYTIKRQSESIDALCFMCFDKKLQKLSRFYGPGGFMLVESLLVLYVSGRFNGFLCILSFATVFYLRYATFRFTNKFITVDINSDTNSNMKLYFEVIPIVGDGDCLYNAFIKGLELQTTPSKLRSCVARYILDNDDMYTDLISNWKDFGVVSKEKAEQLDKETVASRIRNTKEWATSTEIHILSVLFNVDLYVVKKINDKQFVQRFPYEWKSKNVTNKKLYLLNSGWHFELLKPVAGDVSVLSFGGDKQVTIDNSDVLDNFYVAIIVFSIVALSCFI